MISLTERRQISGVTSSSHFGSPDEIVFTIGFKNFGRSFTPFQGIRSGNACRTNAAVKSWMLPWEDLDECKSFKCLYSLYLCERNTRMAAMSIKQKFFRSQKLSDMWDA